MENRMRSLVTNPFRFPPTIKQDSCPAIGMPRSGANRLLKQNLMKEYSLAEPLSM